MASKDIIVNVPSKYISANGDSNLTSPPLDWFCTTWAVTHSTLSMWRSAKNVRITYKDLKDGTVDDFVEYEKGSSLKNVAGIDKPLGPGAWQWRGKGFLKLISSQWEVIGWGERPLGEGDQVERWIVTWFQKTLFTEEGVDILTDQKGGLTEETLGAIMTQLKALKDAPEVVRIVESSMRPVEIQLPWKLKDA